MTLWPSPAMRAAATIAIGLASAIAFAPLGSTIAEARGAKQASTRITSRGAKRQKRSAPPLEAPPPHYTPSLPIRAVAISCPIDMVAVAGTFCIDRYEAALVDTETNVLLSPFYPPDAALARELFETWTEARARAPEGTPGRLIAVPPVRFTKGRPKAVSAPGLVPNGYLSEPAAKDACEAAGKRLCRESEWVTACRGERQTTFPYGATFEPNRCNVFREDHPARLLHGSASSGHLDPRLNVLALDGEPLLRATGETPTCASVWGADAVFDLVGNLDEWIDDPDGTFVGGFYSRATRSGCNARISTHPAGYFDYSTGVRCCADPR